jgi:anti-sigma regulatory factor (Ser/Thr protein kinase)
MSRKKDRIILTFTDFNVEKYDINQTEKYDTHQPLKERPVGKLGIHMVKKLMDKVEYRYKNHNSTITLVKYVRDGYV